MDYASMAEYIEEAEHTTMRSSIRTRVGCFEIVGMLPSRPLNRPQPDPRRRMLAVADDLARSEMDRPAVSGS
jgi:hypothetical protein